MESRMNTKLAAAIPALALGLYAATAAAPAAVAAGPATACTLTADTIKTGQASVPVNVRYSEEIGDSLMATIADGSRIMVISVRRNPAPRTAQVLLNTEVGKVGEWDLAVSGTKGHCNGLLTVTQATRK